VEGEKVQELLTRLTDATNKAKGEADDQSRQRFNNNILRTTPTSRV